MISILSDAKHNASSNKRTENFNGIDLVKFFCAILVFIIHISPVQNPISEFSKNVLYGLKHGLCRIAVPFYFVCSGFFLFNKMPLYELNTERVKHYCYKILRLVGIWHVLLFIGGTGHLWYLGATVIAVILLSVFLFVGVRFRYICVSACLLYAIGLLGDAYYGVIEPLSKITVFNYLLKGYDFAFSTTRNGVFMGFPFVLMGAIFSQYRFGLKPKNALAGFVISVLCLLTEAFWLKYNDIPKDNNMYICLIPVAFFMFSFATSVRLTDRAIYKHLRRIGVLVYFLHMLINEFVWLGISVINKLLGIELTDYQFIISLGCTLIFAMFIEWLSCKEKFKWINLVLS